FQSEHKLHQTIINIYTQLYFIATVDWPNLHLYNNGVHQSAGDLIDVYFVFGFRSIYHTQYHISYGLSIYYIGMAQHGQIWDGHKNEIFSYTPPLFIAIFNSGLIYKKLLPTRISTLFCFFIIQIINSLTSCR
ncbi:hypothetical protein ACJX0J_031841, partial [Zea mays]